MSACVIEGCLGAVHGRGWCCAHYQRWHKYGDPLGRGMVRGTRLPFAPLWNVARPDHAGHLALQLRVTTRTVRRWKVGGVPLIHADAAAAALGMHPTEIWDEWAA